MHQLWMKCVFWWRFVNSKAWQKLKTLFASLQSFHHDVGAIQIDWFLSCGAQKVLQKNMFQTACIGAQSEHIKRLNIQAFWALELAQKTKNLRCLGHADNHWKNLCFVACSSSLKTNMEQFVVDLMTCKSSWCDALDNAVVKSIQSVTSQCLCEIGELHAHSLLMHNL